MRDNNRILRHLVPLLSTLSIACGSAFNTVQLPDTSFVQQTLLGHAMALPKGFTIGVFAQGLSGVRFMVLGPDGGIYASRSGAGLVMRMVDANHDGVADGVTTVKSGLNYPHGMAFRGDTLFVAEMNQVVKLVPPAMGAQVVVPGIPTSGHATRTIVFRGDTLYLSVGSSCNICDESDSRRAAVTSYLADGSGGATFAAGLRNSVGLVVHPETHEIWATNNDRDNLGDDVPPDRVNILQRGGFYGWPQCYLPGKLNPEYPADQVRCESVIAPAVLIGRVIPVDPALSSSASAIVDYAELALEIKRWGGELGFQQIGISATDLARDEAHLLNWIAAGREGEMEYM